MSTGNLSSAQFKTMYHRTDSGTASKILSEGKLVPGEGRDKVYLTDHPAGAEGYGYGVVEVQVAKGKSRALGAGYNYGAEHKWYAAKPEHVTPVRAYSDLETRRKVRNGEL